MRQQRIISTASWISLVIALVTVYLLWRSYTAETAAICDVGICRTGFGIHAGEIEFFFFHNPARTHFSPPEFDFGNLSTPYYVHVDWWFKGFGNTKPTGTGRGIYRSLWSPLLFWLALLLILPCIRVILWLRKPNLDAAPRCTNCDYDLRGHAAVAITLVKCPECGTVSSAENPVRSLKKTVANRIIFAMQHSALAANCFLLVIAICSTFLGPRFSSAFWCSWRNRFSISDDEEQITFRIGKGAGREASYAAIDWAPDTLERRYEFAMGCYCEEADPKKIKVSKPLFAAGVDPLEYMWSVPSYYLQAPGWLILAILMIAPSIIALNQIKRRQYLAGLHRRA